MALPKKKLRVKNDRMHLRLDEELKKRMEEYVARHKTTLSAVASVLFKQMLAEEDAKQYDAEQV